MVRIRLRRVGLKNQPSYRIVAAEKENKRDGKYLEILGTYNPRTDPSSIAMKEDRVFAWLQTGAQPSESVMQIFKSVGLLDRYEKFKGGESIESVLEESKTFYAAREINVKTRKDAPKSK